MLFQRMSAWFPGATSGSLQWPVIPVSEGIFCPVVASVGIFIHVCTFTQINIYTSVKRINL